MKWEYFIANSEEMLHELGDQGWELVTVIPGDKQDKYYFKKPKKDLKERLTEEQRKEIYRQLSPEDTE